MFDQSKIPLTVLLADDSKVIRQAISGLLSACEEVRIVGEAESFSEAVKLIAEVKPDVTLLDVHMPNPENLTNGEIREGCEKSRVLAVSLFDDEETAELAAQYGAYTLLEKGTLGTELIPILRDLGSAPAN